MINTSLTCIGVTKRSDKSCPGLVLSADCLEGHANVRCRDVVLYCSFNETQLKGFGVSDTPLYGCENDKENIFVKNIEKSKNLFLLAITRMYV